MKSLLKYIFSVLTVKGCGLYLAISFATGLHGQNLETYQIKETHKIDSVVSAFNSKDKLKALSLLPSVSYNFQTGVSVGFSLNNFIQFTQTKKRNKIEAMKLKVTLEEKLKEDLEKGELEKETIELLKDEIVLNIQVLKNRYELYKIAFIKHNNNEITFSDFTTKKINYLEKYNTVFSKISKLDISILKYKQKYNVVLFDSNVLITNIKMYEIAN